MSEFKPNVFNGEYSAWNEWKALHDNLIHENETLDNTQKFHYLKNAVEGAAARVLNGWQVMGENYLAAYNSLVEVYQNQYRLILAHLDELFNMQKQMAETHDGLRTMVDTTKSVLRQLEALNVPVDQWDCVVIHLILHRLPPRTMTAWETSQDL